MSNNILCALRDLFVSSYDEYEWLKTNVTNNCYIVYTSVKDYNTGIITGDIFEASWKKLAPFIKSKIKELIRLDCIKKKRLAVCLFLYCYVLNNECYGIKKVKFYDYHISITQSYGTYTRKINTSYMLTLNTVI